MNNTPAEPAENSLPQPGEKGKSLKFYSKPVLTQLGDLRTHTLGGTYNVGGDSTPTAELPYWKVGGIILPP